MFFFSHIIIVFRLSGAVSRPSRPERHNAVPTKKCRKKFVVSEKRLIFAAQI